MNKRQREIFYMLLPICIISFFIIEIISYNDFINFLQIIDTFILGTITFIILNTKNTRDRKMAQFHNSLMKRLELKHYPDDPDKIDIETAFMMYVAADSEAYSGIYKGTKPIYCEHLPHPNKEIK